MTRHSGPQEVQATLQYQSTPQVQDVLAKMKRTEDLCFSPNRTQMAIAAFCSNRILVFQTRFEASAEIPRIYIDDYIEISSTTLRKPHGLAFIGEHTLVVANRAGAVNIFTLPEMGDDQKQFNLDPIRTIGDGRFCNLDSPGSIDAYHIGKGVYRLLICNNYGHTVTTAYVFMKPRCMVLGHHVLLEKALEIPDGVCVSSDQKWIAISNHIPSKLLIYPNRPTLHRRSDPVAVLHGMDCPHGVRFFENDQKIIVVDSADPTLCIYATGDQGWKGDYYPVRTLRILDDITFQLGRYNVEEGGPKGIDLDPVSGVAAVTCEHQPLSFYDLRSLLETDSKPAATRSPQNAALERL